MKKLLSLSLSAALAFCAVSCGGKKSSAPEENSVPDPVVTQTLYKETPLDLPKEISNVNRIRANADGSFKALYYDENYKLRAADVSADFKLAGTYPVSSPENTVISVFTFNADGGLSALLIHCDDMEALKAGEVRDEDVTFGIAQYDADISFVSEVELTGFEKYYSSGSTFFTSLSKRADGGHILCTSNNALNIDASGKITASAELRSLNYYYAVGDGRVAAFDNINGYGFADPDTLEPPSETKSFEKPTPLAGPPCLGDENYLCYILLNEGLYGLTHNGNLQMLVDFTTLFIEAMDATCIAPAGEGKFLMSYWDNLGARISMIEARPADYVNERKKVVIAGAGGNTEDYEIANAFAKANDDYIVEYRDYTKNYVFQSDELRNDILTGDAPDLYICPANEVYRYSNLGAFMTLDELNAKYGGITREELLPNVAESLELKGEIYALCDRFTVGYGYVAKRDVVPREDACWDFDRFLEIYDSLPESEYLFTQESVSNKPEMFFFDFSDYASYIDFDSASCSFDGDNFVRNLKFLKEARTLTPYDSNYYSTATEQERAMDAEENSFMVVKDKALLAEQLGYSKFFDFITAPALNHLKFSEATLVFPPSEDGVGNMDISNFYGVIRNGKNHEGAWAFVNFILGRDMQANEYELYKGFPVRKDAFDLTLDLARSSLTDTTYTINGYSLDIPNAVSDEDFEYIRSFITSTKTSITGIDEELRQIIIGESNRYLSGDCSAEECAEAIQDRVSIFLSERS